MDAGDTTAISTVRTLTPLVSSRSRPRAFGRSSNIWQYVDQLQDRKTPPVLPPGSRNPRQHIVDEHLDGEDSDSFSDPDRDSDADSSSSSPQHHQPSNHHHQHHQAHHHANDGRRPSRQSNEHRRVSFLQAVGGRTTSDAYARRNSQVLGPIAHKYPHRKGSIDAKNGKSSTEADVPAKKHSILMHNPPNLSHLMAPSPSAAAITPSIVKRAVVSGHDVIRRIQTLGTSASAPVLSTVNGLSGTTTNPTTNVPAATAPTGATGAPAAAVTASAAAAASVATLSDAEKLQNDFNSQHSRLYYGCSIALELFNGHLMMVGHPEGNVLVQSLEKLKAPQVRGTKDRAVFTLIDLTDPRSANSIRYGDSVWLQISAGSGDVSWEQGGVLGAKVREAPQLKTLALADENQIRNDVQAPVIVGHPVPIKAYLPKTREEGENQVDEIQSRVRNKAPKSLGKWIIRSAVLPKRKQKDDFVYNNDEIYLEQDWFYLGADSDAGIAVLRQLPPSSALKDVKKGEYVVERRGAWRIRLLDSSNGSSGMTLAQQQMERLLLKAKNQLKHSKKMRAGQTKMYGPNIHGGAQFVSQLRTQLVSATKDCEHQYLEYQEQRMGHLGSHLGSKAEAMNRMMSQEDGMELPTEFEPLSTPEQPSSSGEFQRPTITIHVPAHPQQHVPHEHDKPDEVCALCQSSSIAYNLCSQIHHVMHSIEHEVEMEKSMRAKLRNASATSKLPPSTSPGASSSTATTTTNSEHPPHHYDPPPSSPSNKKKSPRFEKEKDRILKLFADQDQKIMGVIKFKEKEAAAAKMAEEQARVGLSPVATHFRDRFKHVGLLAQFHQRHAEEEHGIGRHFHQLHKQLAKDARLISKSHRLQQSSSELSDDDMRMCPFEYPPEGFDVYGNPIDPDDEDPMPQIRLFPTPDELDKIPPVDTKQISELYQQNRHAVLEMLTGFMELAETQIVPNLQAALDSRNRASLVEILDFTARSAEFICAHRVQVQVARLLHAIAASDVGDFESFQPIFDLCMKEVHGAISFIKFYCDKMAKKKTMQKA